MFTPPNPRRGEVRPGWTGEAWSVDDGLVLNLPIFDGCTSEFKRKLLRNIRAHECEVNAAETWYDAANDKIITLDKMPEDLLPPLRREHVGKIFDPDEVIWNGGDFEQSLVVVLSGTVIKLVGSTPSGGRIPVRELHRGDYEGVAEFLGVGTEQRCSAMRAGPDGARCRFVPRNAVQDLLKQTIGNVAPPDPNLTPGRAPPTPPAKLWPVENAYFKTLALDRIDSMPHAESKQLLQWKVAGDEPLNYMKMPGQDLFTIDNNLGLSVSGPLPEGIEDRYFFPGQTVVKRGIPADCMVMILRGEVEADIPEGCGNTIIPSLDLLQELPAEEGATWLGDARREPVEDDFAASIPSSRCVSVRSARSARAAEHAEMAKQVPAQELPLLYVSTLCRPERMRTSKKRIEDAAAAGRIPSQDVNDWRWSWDDPVTIKVLDMLEHMKLLTELGLEKAEAVRLYQNPPIPDPPPVPRAIVKPGGIIGQLAPVGMPVVFAGAVRARTPVLVAVLHRHVLLEGIDGQPELSLFIPEGVSMPEMIKVLSTPPPKVEAGAARGEHQSPATGPPHADVGKRKGPAAGTHSAWREEGGVYAGRAAADAMFLILLNALKESALLWGILSDAPPRLMEAFVAQFEPLYLLPNEVLVKDEEPDCNFMIVVVHGTLVAFLEGAEVARCGQGQVTGEAQLLGLNDWTRTMVVDPMQKGEALVYILRRDRMVSQLAGHPAPKQRLREVEVFLLPAREADWKILKAVPTFRSIDNPKFMMRLWKDADILYFCPGDHIAVAGDPGSSLVMILAGTLRGELPLTLFQVELQAGKWCFQNNILGNVGTRDHDLISVTHSMVLILHRHVLLNAVADFPETRPVILDNESWRADVPPLSRLRIYDSVPEPVLSRLTEEGRPMYYKRGALILGAGCKIEDDDLLVILRGEVKVSMMGIHIRDLGPGDTIGALRYLGLNCEPAKTDFVCSSSVDALKVSRALMLEALEDERYEDDLVRYKQSVDVFGGAFVRDAYGAPTGGGGVDATDCVETSPILRNCSWDFRLQIPQMVEEVPFWPGEKLYSQDDFGTFMFFIKTGRVRLEMMGIKTPQKVDAGATLGEMAVLDQVGGHTATAFAETHVWARVLHRDMLKRALIAFPADERALYNTASKVDASTLVA